MNWLTGIFKSNIGKKIIMSLSGLFLCLFLVIHLVGNLQIIFDSSGEMFNRYSYTMSNSKFILLASVITYVAILAHVVYALLLTLANKKARPQKYASDKSKGAIWSSRNMGLLGTLILVFIILHLSNFWYKFKFGTGLPMIEYNIAGSMVEMKDYYQVVVASFAELWYTALYVVSMFAIGFHLWHGFRSAWQSIGINHPQYTPFIKTFGIGYSILIPLLFAIIPIYVYLQQNGII